MRLGYRLMNDIKYKSNCRNVIYFEQMLSASADGCAANNMTLTARRAENNVKQGLNCEQSLHNFTTNNAAFTQFHPFFQCKKRNGTENSFHF